MGLEEAYSIERNEIIDAERAYDLYWSGQLSDKKAFQCPDEKCNAHVTCACMDIVEQNLKQVPHFRIISEHSSECTLFDDENKIEYSTENPTNIIGINRTKSKEEKFYFSRPKNSDTNQENTETGINKTSIKKTTNTSGYNQGENIRRFHSLRPIIKNWLNYRKNGILESKNIDFERLISYKDLFKGVYHQDIRFLGKENFIYWGIAFIDSLKNKKGYQVKFTEYLISGELNKRPSFFISNEMIEKYEIKNLLIKRLETISKSDKNRCVVFIYSKPTCKKEYINFNIDNLDLLEIRYLNFFEEIKSTVSVNK
ncbi:MAG: hypothetical protein WC656_11345 [Sulfurimonas sp.]|jgi:hypothetical protein